MNADSLGELLRHHANLPHLDLSKPCFALPFALRVSDERGLGVVAAGAGDVESPTAGGIEAVFEGGEGDGDFGLPAAERHLGRGLPVGVPTDAARVSALCLSHWATQSVSMD